MLRYQSQIHLFVSCRKWLYLASYILLLHFEVVLNAASIVLLLALALVCRSKYVAIWKSARFDRFPSDICLTLAKFAPVGVHIFS